MHNAASMSGLAFSNSHLGMAHSMGHALGATYGMAHGLSVALSNLYVIQFNRNVSAERYAEVAQALGVDTASAKDVTVRLVATLRDLMKRLGQPTTLKEFGIKHEDLMRDMKSVIDKTNMSACTFVAPRIPSAKEMEGIYLCAFDGRDVDF